MDKEILTLIHGIFGGLILASALLLFFLEKGTTLHKRIGKVYFYSWPIILITGYLIGSMVIVAIVFMGFYLAITGVRFAQRKNKPYQGIDKFILVVAALVLAFMFYASVRLFLHQQFGFAIVSCVFTLLYGFVISADTSSHIFHRPILKSKQKSNWYLMHLQRMNLSFLTAVSAFAAVQQVFEHDELNFLLPGLLGAFAVRSSVNYFRKKMEK
jgi:hypothetical protein